MVAGLAGLAAIVLNSYESHGKSSVRNEAAIIVQNDQREEKYCLVPKYGYAEQFNMDAVDAMGARVASDVANAFGRVRFAKKGCAQQYFSAEQIITLVQNKKTIEQVTAYWTDQFSPVDVFLLATWGVEPLEANRYARLKMRYGAEITALDILKYREEKIPFAQVKFEARERWVGKSVRE